MKKLILLLLISFISSTAVFGGPQKRSIVGIDEQLGASIPGELKFTDEHGRVIELNSLIDKPVIFMFVYYECPGICSPLMNDVANQISKLDLKPGTDYRLVSVSFDPTENYELAAKKKHNYMGLADIEIPDNGWSFLTGDSASIAKLTDAVGFRYKKEGDEYIHAGALIAVSPKGIVTRYLLGTEFLPFDIKMAIIEAGEGKVMPTIAKVLKFCYSYDPDGRKYALNITRIAGTVIILTAIVFVLLLTFYKRKDLKLKKA